MYDYSGKVIVVTGGAGGLGCAIADGFSLAGGKVIILDTKPPQMGDRSQMEFICADVTDAVQVKSAVEKVLHQYKRVDVLVNCAGITRRMPAEEFKEEDFDLVLKVNLKGTFLCCKAFGAAMLQQGKGAIVNIASLGAHVAITNSAAYCASKGGVAQITRTLAVEWASRGVRVNALTPGVFETPLLQQCVDQDEAYGKMMLAKIPMSRFGKPSELAGPAMFLASEEASYITGHILTVDAGYLAQ